jgi:hypothetical protein
VQNNAAMSSTTTASSALVRASSSDKKEEPKPQQPPTPCTIRDNIVISKKELQGQSSESIDSIKQFTYPTYEKFMMSPPGTEHYALLHYLTRKYGKSRSHFSEGCSYHVVDIGTRYIASALALGITGVPTKTFDVPGSTERQRGFRDKTEEEWQRQVKSKGIDITFYNLQLNGISAEELKAYMNTPLVVLDTYHKPYTAPFEREFLQRMINEVNYKGLMVLDDIHMDEEMKRWWKELQDNANEWGYKAYDISHLGHWSGTGILDFSDDGRLAIVD